MGDFVGHVLPGTMLLVLGLWRVWASVARFAADPQAFRVRSWNPVPAPAPRLLELHLIAVGTFLDMCLELFYASPLRALVATGVDHAPTRLRGLEHAGMLLMFFLYAALALASEKKTKTARWLPLPDGALSLVFGSALTAEFLLFQFHSTTHVGLEGYYHHLLLIVLGLAIAAVIAGALLPRSLPADVGAGVLVAAQGMWFYQIALTLYGPMLPAGCVRRFDSPDSDARIECPGAGALERAQVLADSQLFGIVFVAFVYVLGFYAVAAARYGSSGLEMTTKAAEHERGVAATATATAMATEECTI